MKEKLVTMFLMLALLVLFAGASLAQTYVGSTTCGNCHGKLSSFAGTQWATWKDTKHALALRDPDALPGVVSGADANFKAGLDLATHPKFSVYGANAPKLSYDPATGTSPADTTSGYRVTIGAITYVVHRTQGGTGNWKQRFQVKIGKSYYTLPIQYNEIADLDGKNAGWTTYNAGDWYDANNLPKYNNPATLLADITKKASYDLKCMGCHGVNSVLTQDPATNEYVEHTKEWNVGCEACHGPGSDHSATTDKTKIINPKTDLTLERGLEVCGSCHSRGESEAALGGNKILYPYNALAGPFKPGDILSNFYVFTTASGDYWPDEVGPGRTSKSHHQQYLDFTKSGHAAYDPAKPWINVTCFTCHDPHGATSNAHMIVAQMDPSHTGGVQIATKVEDNTLCLSCHATHGPFEYLTRAMVANPAANADTIAAVVSTHTKHSYNPLNGPSRCTDCHNPKVQASAVPYDISAHTFEVVPPEKTLNYQAQGGMPNACTLSCHRTGAASAPTFGFTDATVSKWNEISDVALADTLKRYYGPGGWWFETDPSGNAGAPLLANRVSSMPTVDGSDADAAWSSATELKLRNGAAIKAVYDNQKIVFLVKWQDPTMSMTRGGSWQRQGGAWVKTNTVAEEGGANEDRFTFVWNINVSDFAERGCAVKCHGDIHGGNVLGAYLDKNGEYADEWHMKPARALGAISASQSGTLTFSANDPLDKHQVTSGTITFDGYCDDKLVASRLDPVYSFRSDDGGRHDDAGTSMAKQNRNTDQTAPLYMEKAPVDFIDAMVLRQSEIDNSEAVLVSGLSTADIEAYWAKYVAVNGVVPERILQAPSDSRADLHQAAVWKDGVWTTEYERKLDTGYKDDVQFNDLGKGYFFGTAIMDNAGGDKHNVYDVLHELRFQEFVAVDDRDVTSQPASYALMQNYPNPFNPTTSIRYSVKQAGRVTLKVYNMLGQEVVTMVDHAQNPGTYLAIFEATNLPSGVYFYRLSINNFTATKKMVLMR